MCVVCNSQLQNDSNMTLKWQWLTSASFERKSKMHAYGPVLIKLYLSKVEKGYILYTNHMFTGLCQSL